MENDLSLLEQNVLNTISEHFPFSVKDVVDVYLKYKTFDDTISILDRTCELCIDVHYALEIL